MPNWCENYLRLEVPNKEEADKLVAVLDNSGDEDSVGLLGYLVPEPNYDNQEFKEQSAMFPDWYEWRVHNWGTKWDVDVQDWNKVDNSDGTCTFDMNFDSAWSPPTGVYDSVAQKENWKVFATFIEGGCAFLGYFEDNNAYQYDCDKRDTTNAPSWLVDDYAWYYDQLDEWEQEEDVENINAGTMTEDQFLVKWGVDTYNIYKESMNPNTDEPEKKDWSTDA